MLKIKLSLASLLLGLAVVASGAVVDLQCGDPLVTIPMTGDVDCVPSTNPNCLDCTGDFGGTARFVLAEPMAVTVNVQNVFGRNVTIIETSDPSLGYTPALFDVFPRTFHLPAGNYETTARIDSATLCGPPTGESFLASVVCAPIDVPLASRAEVVSRNLNELYWEAKTLDGVFDPPKFQSSPFALSMEVESGGESNTFGFWQSKIPIVLPEGFWILKTGFDPIAIDAHPTPDVRVRIASVDGLVQSIGTSAASGPTAIKGEVETFIHSDGVQQFYIAVDLLSFDATKAGGVIVRRMDFARPI